MTTKQDILQSAIQLERDGRKFYLDVASKTPDEKSRRMFESFADDELQHIKWIEQISTGGKTATSAKKNLYERLSSIFAKAPENIQQEAIASQDDIKAINIAIEMEKKSQTAYNKWAEESDNEELQSLCKTLSEIEQFHQQVLENTIEYFERPGDWFMKEERWIFEGG